ncbi:MAG: hypothetical protein AAFV29_18290, partial [Myxococcota bacterium]
MHGADEFYRPLEDLPVGFRLALPRGEGRRAMMSVRTLVDRFATGMGLRPSPLSEQVPLWDVIEDEDASAVLITPAGVAVIGYELRGLHTVYSDAEVVLERCRRLNFAAAQLPDHWEAQFILHAETAPPAAYADFRRLRSDASSIGQVQADVRAEFLAERRPRWFRLRLYVSKARNDTAPFRARPDPSESLKAAAAAEAFLKSADIGMRRLSSEEVLADFARFLRSDPSSPTSVDVLPNESPRAALLQAPVTWTPDAVRIGKRFVKVLTLTKLQGATEFTDIETLFLQKLPFDLCLVAYVRAPPRVRTRTALELSSRIAHATAEGARVPSGLAHERFEDLREALETDQSGKQRVLHFGLQVAVWGGSLAEVQNRAEELQSRLLQKNYLLLEETSRHDQQYLTAMMPGGMPRFDRWMSLMSNNVVSLLPLFDSRSGDDVPACLFESDRGELWAYDPSASYRSNWNS